MIPFMEKFIMKKKTEQETAQDICKKFLKNVITNETNIGTKKFRNDLYKNLIEYGVWNNFDFCMKMDLDDFVKKSGYKKADDVVAIINIRKTIKENHFK